MDNFSKFQNRLAVEKKDVNNSAVTHPVFVCHASATGDNINFGANKVLAATGLLQKE